MTFRGPIPVTILPFFWLLILVIGWLSTGTFQGTLIWAVAILVSILIHEFGHALTALFFGQKAEIFLEGLGGVTRRDGPPISKWKEFVIVLNGPLAGLSLYVLAVILFPYASLQGAVITEFFQTMIYINLFWTILNLFPVLPLDGGHLLRLILEGLFGFKGRKISFLFSTIFGALCGVAFVLIQQFFVGALFMMLAFESFRGWNELKGMAPEDENSHLHLILQQTREQIERGELNEAFANVEYVRNQAPKGVLYVTATELGAQILSRQGSWKKSYDWLLPLKNRLSVPYLHLLQQLAYRLEEWEETVLIGQKAYKEEPSVNSALLNAFSYGIMGQAVPAAGWLQCAKQLGLPNIEEVLKKREFDSVRLSLPFQVFQKK